MAKPNYKDWPIVARQPEPPKNFGVFNNRGAQLGVFENEVDARDLADEVNLRGGDGFAWVMSGRFEVEDMPGRGLIYG